MFIRKMVESDFDSIVEIEKLTFTDPLCCKNFKNALKKNNVFAYTYLEGQRILAYVLLRVDGSIVNITSMTVHPDFRRKGIATECIRFVERFSHTKKCTRVHLDIQESNLSAQLLFRKAGYKATMILRNHYPRSHEDGYMMVKRLGEVAQPVR